MKKIIALLLTVVSLAFCLTGCVYEELGVKLNKDGTGSIETTIGLKKEFVKQLTELGGSDPFDGKETTEIEYDGETYIAFTDTKEYETFEDMEKALAEMTFNANGMDGAFTSQPDDDTGVTLQTEDATVNTETSFFKSVKIKNRPLELHHSGAYEPPGLDEGGLPVPRRRIRQQGEPPDCSRCSASIPRPQSEYRGCLLSSGQRRNWEEGNFTDYAGTARQM